MENIPLISVIVPVYKINKMLLEQCLNSLSDQSFQNVEYLVIDDGSPDNCGEICDSFAEKDSRIKVFHLPNGGVSKARNYGLEKSRGKYIVFVDGDDYITPNFIEKISETAEKENKDIIFFRNLKCFEDGKMITMESDFTSGSKLSPEIIAMAITANDEKKLNYAGLTFGSPWGKIYRAEYLKNNKLEFPVGIRKSQDRIFVLKALSFNPSIATSDICGYVYIVNDTSICKRFNPDIINILNEAGECFYETINTYYSGNTRTELMKAYNYLQLDFFFIILQLYFFNKSYSNKDKNDINLFQQLCKSKQKFFSNCSPKKIIRKKRALILRMLKLRCYKFLYRILKKIYSV